jgi:2-polyprenyl-3-methyl-5-hydroxy-6-metoxy-1,4-benzoquinol methylase
LLERIGQHFPTNLPRKLLDFGAGGGGFLKHARGRGWDVSAFEPGARGLAACRNLGLDATDRLTDLPVNGFSLITMHHVLEHIAEPFEVLSEIERLLMPGGVLFIEVPNAASLRARLAMPFLTQRYEIDERYRAYPIHLMYYSAATLTRLLQKGNWRIESLFTVGMGVDEYFVKTSARSAEPRSSKCKEAVGSRRRRRFRHRLRDRFLQSGLGENLSVVASPCG